MIAGLGIEGDAHAGITVQHRSRARWHPSDPNLRQVHLVQSELFDELEREGLAVLPGELGENITTVGIDLLALSTGTRLHLGATAVVEVTGLRNPYVQIDRFQPGLLKAVVDRAEDGTIIRKTGVMAIVLEGGVVRPGDPIDVRPADGIHRPLQPV